MCLISFKSLPEQSFLHYGIGTRLTTRLFPSRSAYPRALPLYYLIQLMAILLLPMSAIPDIPHHMTAAHGHSVPPNLSHNPSNVATQPANRRPKLSLQTTSLASTYGSLTRGVAPNTTQTLYTPTTANTLANTWDLSIRPSPVSRTESPRPLLQIRPSSGTSQQPYAYSLPFGLRPILKNSPLPPRAASVSASPRESRRKVFFPQPKRVSFRNNLEEPIETKHYIARHVDLTSSEEETSDEEPQQESSSLKSDESQPTSTYHTSPPPNRKRKVRRDSGIYIDPRAEPLTTISSSSDDNITIKPLPPCKRRKWQSTSSFGGPIEKEGAALKRNSSSTSDPDGTPTSSEDTYSAKEPSTVDDRPAKQDDGEVCSITPLLRPSQRLPDLGITTNLSSETEQDATSGAVANSERS